jgi:hypothetical protein
MGAGMAATQRLSGFHKPATTIMAPVTRKAPTAAENPPSTSPAEASRAAPGVDQAMLIGIRVIRLISTPQTPMVIESAIRPDAACAGLAPTARSPGTTTVALAKPTREARMPAVSA